MMQDFKGSPFHKLSVFSPKMITNTLFGLALLIVISFNIFSFSQVNKLTAANQWVVHTYRVIQSVNDVFLNLVQIESGVRGFIITKSQKGMEHMNSNITSMYKEFDLAKKLTNDNPIQYQRIKALEPMLNTRVNLIKQSLQALSLGQSKNTSISLVTQGIELTSKISLLIEEITSYEMNLLTQRNTTYFAELNELNHILLLTSILSAFLFIIGIIALNINLARQYQFVQEKIRYENLLKSIIEGTNDIIVVLDIHFCFITFNHSFEHEFKALFGVRPRIGANIVDILAHLPDEQKKIAALWKRALSGEEFNLVGHFGGSMYNNVYECNFNSIYDSNGLLLGAAAICRNIQHRIDAEKSLQNTNEKLEQAYHALKHHDTDVSILNEMENALQSCSSIEETTMIISKYCPKLLPFSAGIIYLINPSRNYLEEIVAWNSPHITEKVFSPRQCWGLRQGKIYIYIKNGTGITCEHIHGREELSYFCVPLLAQNEVIGLMHIEVIDTNLSETDIQALYEKHEILIKNLSVQLALAIANIQLRETLKNRSIRDPLTGLYNRTYLSEFLERDLQRSQHNHVTVSIVMMDIDYFKRLNDKYGHDAGDAILMELGKVLQDNIGRSDIACRYGGEEFLLIFYDITDEDKAYERIEKIRMVISQMEVSLRGTMLDKITASFGMAIFPKHGTTVEALVTAADQALFLSKKNGRNQLTVYH